MVYVRTKLLNKCTSIVYGDIPYIVLYTGRTVLNFKHAMD